MKLIAHRVMLLYPFCASQPFEEVLKQLRGSPRWKRQQIPPDSSEALYIQPRFWSLLFENRFVFRDLDQLLVRYEPWTVRVVCARLNVLDEGIGCLALEMELAPGQEGLTLADLLNFQEEVRYIDDLYQGHRTARARFHVLQSNTEIMTSGGTEDFLGFFLREVGPTERLYDQRLITYSFVACDTQLTEDEFYKVINVDSAQFGLPEPAYVGEFLKRATYTRWRGSSILYGFTHYSGACVVKTERVGAGEDFSHRWLLEHFRTLYLDLAELVYFQFGVLQRLAHDLSQLDMDDSKGFTRLLASYTRFVQTYWFARVTDQDQGRELYRLSKSILEADYQLFASVTEQIKTLRRWFDRRPA